MRWNRSRKKTSVTNIQTSNFSLLLEDPVFLSRFMDFGIPSKKSSNQILFFTGLEAINLKSILNWIFSRLNFYRIPWITWHDFNYRKSNLLSHRWTFALKCRQGGGWDRKKLGSRSKKDQQEMRGIQNLGSEIFSPDDFGIFYFLKSIKRLESFINSKLIPSHLYWPAQSYF